MRIPQVLTTFGLVASTLIGVAAVAQSGGTGQAAPPVLELDVRAVPGVPADATAAVLNIAAARAQSPGFVAAWPCDQPEPDTASLNYRPGAAVSNSSIVTLSAAGTVCLSRSSDVELVVDINSAFRAGGTFIGQNPERLLDTRQSQPLAAGQQLVVDVAGEGLIPAGASAAAVNIAAARADEAGYIVAWPCGSSKPTTAALNYRSGAAVSNTTTVGLSTDGQLCIEASSSIDVIIDANGAFTSTTAAPFNPRRLVDTRLASRLHTGTILEVQVAGEPGVPADATAAAVNITAARPSENGYVVAWPCGTEQPEASSLNYDDRPVSNSTIIGLGTNGTICMSASTNVDLVVDLHAAFPEDANIASLAPQRIVDTRPTPVTPTGDSPDTTPTGDGPETTPTSRPRGDVAPPTATGPYRETFDAADSLDRLDIEVHHRSDHNPASGWAEGGGNLLLGTNTWGGDHDLSCGPPTSKRTLNAQDRVENSYWCRQHLMTSVADVDGYSTIAFSPRLTFPTVSRVCWDQNVTDMGSRQWTELKVTPADSLVFDGEYHLASTGPGQRVDPFAAQAVEGTLNLRFLPAYDGLRAWQSDQDQEILRDPYYGQGDPEGLNSQAIRRQHCVTDLGNGQLRLTIDQGDSEYRQDFPGYFPANARVVFEDHNYTPDKDGNAQNRYTWHWDNLTIE